MPFSKLIERARSGSSGLMQFALLAASILIGPALTNSSFPGWSRWLATLAAAALVFPGTTAERGLRRFATRGPSIAVVAGVTIAVWRFWWNEPWISLIFLPLWIGGLLLIDIWSAVPVSAANKVQAFVKHDQTDIWLGEAIGVGLALRLGATFLPQIGHVGTLVLAGTVGWLGLRRIGSIFRLGRSALLDTVILTCETGILIAALSLIEKSSSAARAWIAIAVWTSVALWIYRSLLRKVASRPGNGSSENLRWIILALVGCWVLRGFARTALHGTSDALWYGTMLADMVQQTRHGIFPVWIGQSVFQFNGAIYPLRVAPLFHYLGGLLDLLTLQQLGVFALQNFLITVVGLAAVVSTYFAFRKLLSDHAWYALGLTILFIACPGVLGIAYNSDLYMSWTTLPWIPLVWYASVRSWQHDKRDPSLILLGLALGLCWWGHSPIALWSTLVAAVVQASRLLTTKITASEVKASFLAAGVFSVVAAYPIGSVLVFPPEPGVSASSFQRATAGTIAHFLREVFPATLQPLSSNGRQLSDFQMGYALWAAWIVGFWLCRKARRLDAWMLWAVGSTLIILLTPWPGGLDERLWALVPAFVRDTTSNWVMNRLYLILAITLLTSFAISLGSALSRSGKPSKLANAAVAIACLWSLAETGKFVVGSREGARPEDKAEDALRPENVQVTRFAYLVYPRLPATFSHGVVDPALEQRLLTRDGATTLLDAHQAAWSEGRPVTRATLKPRGDNPAWLVSPQPFVLEPGHRYLFRIEAPATAKLEGTLQFIGPSLFRQYSLPEYGEPLSFGWGANHRAIVPVWTTASAGEPMTIQFVPTAPVGAPFSYSIVEYNEANLPIALQSLLPFRERVNAPAPAVLETPRMYQPYYRATVNGSPAHTAKSPLGLLGVEVPAGVSEVEISYHPPLGLVCAFWTSIAGIAVSIAWVSLQFRRYAAATIPQAPALAATPASRFTD